MFNGLGKHLRSWCGKASGRGRGIGMAILLGGSFMLPAAAQASYPERPVTLIVPFAPGGSSDIIGRVLANPLAEKLGQSVIVENVSGVGGVLGTQKAVRSTADGYTVLLGSGSEILINKLINPSGVSYDGLQDLVPVAFVGTGPMVLVGRPGLPARTISEVLDLARKDALSYASAGNGTPMHVAGELLQIRSKTQMTHVPYRGASPALVDIMGDQVDLGVSTLAAAQSHIQAGRVQAYAVTSAEKSDLAPSLPALGQEPGLEGFDLNVWFGLFVPRDTPAAVVEHLQSVAQEVLASEKIKADLAAQGISVSGASGQELRKYMEEQVEIYREVVKTANMRAE
ncbi:Bug family tripartite tricarboxylate transporter substrate binding protein [Paracandidimonas soli]|uniref:Tripartite-type tricarboxylate transporter receptor subunit TctC n=1 Tax=Paracandidimonas soli TaxID=1917182 RepID=A0A4R3UT11_9BURK|nr:tripartite tricarboxylate transporter substrate-binding protein [Paracandidimonas soli]TCU93174.1 tripartite-type tricarboxylate transporter receptor subunit TctC [Paracandidimonas soli]